MNNISQPIMQPGCAEFLANNGEVYCIENGSMVPFSETSLQKLTLLRNDLERHPGAIQALELLNITDPLAQLRQYAACMFGELNNSPDFLAHRRNPDDEEFVQLHCSVKNCPYKGKLCNLLHIMNFKLSEREVQVLRLKSQFKTPEQIADDLGIALNTVRVHIQKLLQKFGFSSSEQLTAWAASHLG
jgi:DNA-binding CsgD family transcriptional regulator